MARQSDRESTVARRDFLKFVGVAGAATALPAETSAAEMPAASTASPSGGARPPLSVGYVFFNSNEATFVEAAVDTLIPSDTVGPGALELGVATFIDRQLAGSFGKGHRLYLEEPLADGTPQQGYQLSLTPSELMKAGIVDVDAYALRTHKNLFAGLTLSGRAAVLHDVEFGEADLATVPNATFFNLLLQLTVEGYFADPIYGGNKDKASWKMIGFPGAGVVFTDLIAPYRNRKNDVEPVEIQDLF